MEWLTMERYFWWAPQCQISINYKYAPDVSKIVVLYYDGYCLFWYKHEDLVKWFVDSLGTRIHVKFVGYPHWFMSISISQLKNYLISVDQDRYATAVMSTYLDTATVQENSKFVRLPCLMIQHSLNKMLLQVMTTWEYCLTSTKFTTELVWDH